MAVHKTIHRFHKQYFRELKNLDSTFDVDKFASFFDIDMSYSRDSSIFVEFSDEECILAKLITGVDILALEKFWI